MATVSLYSPASSRLDRKRRTFSTGFFGRTLSVLRLSVLKAGLHSPKVRATVALATLFFALEALVRIAEYGAGSTLSDTQGVAALKLPAGAAWQGLSVNSWGYWDDDFNDAPPAEGVRRVALLGNGALLAGDAETNVAAQLEREMKGLEVDHFALPQAGPREFAAQINGDVKRRNPQTALVCLPMTSVVSTSPPSGTWVDWHTIDLLASLTTSPAYADSSSLSLLEPAADNYDEFIRRRSSSIAACRLSGDDVEAAQRRADQDAIARTAATCCEAGIRLVLVLVPGEFQLSPQLTAAYCRRQECEPTALDIELPQRRWRAFAEHIGVETIDLLPALREANEIVYETNSPHWNRRGLELVAGAIGRGL